MINLKIYNLKDKLEYIKEFILICHNEWGGYWEEDKIDEKINERIPSTIKRLEKYPTLLLVENNTLLGFVSLFENDCEKLKEYTPWYATLYVKEDFRGNHFSKILTDAIISEAKRLNFRKIYLKTTLNNFYEKLGFVYLETTSDNEKIYFMNLK